MFMGQYNSKVDSKGRAVVPAKVREELGSSFVITKGLDDCIYAFPMDKWEEMNEKLSKLSIASKNARTFTRFFLAGAANLDIDGQGRVLIPEMLRKHASLEKEVVWIGIGDKLEIWNPDKFIENTEVSDQNIDDIAEQMAELGI